MTEQELIDLMVSDSICGGRVYPIKAPQAVTTPYAVYDVLRGSLSQELDGDCGVKNRYMFTCWCDSYAQAVATVTAFKTSLLTYGFMAGTPLIDIDPDDETLYRIINLDFDIIE